MARSRSWNTGEVRRLRELWDGRTVEEVAEELGRSSKSVREKAREVGLPRKVERGQGAARTRWRVRDDRALLMLVGRGVPVDRVARALQRSERACRRRLRELHAESRETRSEK